MKYLNKVFVLVTLLSLSVGAMAQTEYKRIVSLVPSVTQSIYSLEAQDKIVGCTSYCKQAVADGKPVVSSAIKMNVEKVVALKPDLVFASGLTNPKDIETLRKFNVNVVTFPTPISIEEIYNQFFELGGYLGLRDKAGRIIAQVRGEVQQIRMAHQNKGKSPRIFFQLGVDPIFAVLKGTFMDNYITILGGQNVASDLEHGTVGREYVLEKNPEYIFIADMGTQGTAGVKEWLQYQNMSAAKDKHVFVIDPEIACQPTPLTFVQTLREMEKVMD